MLAPLVIPGVILGISILAFASRLAQFADDLWGLELDFLRPGLPLVVAGQFSYIVSIATLTIAARLKRFDATLEEAAYNLGASRAAVLRTVTLPYLKPALIGAAAISFLMSFENFNTTLMLVGSDPPLTVMMYGRMREGASPVLNAVSLFLMVASALLALTLLRRPGSRAGPLSARNVSSAAIGVTPIQGEAAGAPPTASRFLAADRSRRAADGCLVARRQLPVGRADLSLDNPLLQEPLQLAHIKPRLLGHWGTTPGLNFIYVHMNRVIRQHDLNMIFVAGPGHGGPAVVANTYLEGTYSEVYPDISQDEEGMRRLFRQFSFPGGIPEPCRAGNAGLHPRGRRAGLCAVPCLWRGVRQPGSDRVLRGRRRRGGNRAARHVLAFQQVSQSAHATARCCRSCI